MKNADLHGAAPDKSPAALILIDVINDLEFEGAEQLLPAALNIAPRLVQLKREAREAGIPIIYANDNFGRWQSDFRRLVDHALSDGVRGEPLARQLQPEAEDYFILKPKHSAFYSTALELLLRYLGTQRLILTGLAGNLCVLYTANDAYMRDYELWVPEDCLASNTEEDNRAALEHMRRFLKAETRPLMGDDLRQLGQPRT